MVKAGVIGAGAWGTAVAVAAQNAGSDVTIWAREREVVESINRHHENTVFLPGVSLSAEIKASNDLLAMLDSNLLFLVPPAQYMRATCENLRDVGILPNIKLVICSKGVEKQSLLLMSEVAGEILPDNPVAIMTGPSFAAETARGLPTFVTIACGDEALWENIRKAVISQHFRPRYSDDIIGAQIAGSVKNVIAIACGLVDGKQLGENTKAALIVGGLRELQELTEAKGGKAETTMRLCGIGDLILTCSSKQSRNFSLGYALGQGKPFSEIMSGRKSVAEGVASSESVTALATKLGIKMPICQAVYTILHKDNVNLDGVIENLIGSY